MNLRPLAPHQPEVGVNNGLDADTPANNGLERFSPDIPDDLGEHFPVPFINAEDDRFDTSSAASFTFDPVGPEVAFVDFPSAIRERR